MKSLIHRLRKSVDNVFLSMLSFSQLCNVCSNKIIQTYFSTSLFTDIPQPLWPLHTIQFLKSKICCWLLEFLLLIFHPRIVPSSSAGPIRSQVYHEGVLEGVHLSCILHLDYPRNVEWELPTADDILAIAPFHRPTAEYARLRNSSFSVS